MASAPDVHANKQIACLILSYQLRLQFQLGRSNLLTPTRELGKVAKFSEVFTSMMKTSHGVHQHLLVDLRLALATELTIRDWAVLEWPAV